MKRTRERVRMIVMAIVRGLWARNCAKPSCTRKAWIAATLGLVMILQPRMSAAVIESAASVRLEDARARMEDGEYVAAIRQYVAAIELIEQNASGSSIDLFEPLLELADAQASADRRRDAVESLQRAVGILRRSGGLYDGRQSELLLRLVDLHSSVGEIDAAADALQYLERLNASEQTPSIRGAQLAQIATWRCRIGQFDAGRKLVRDALRLSEPRNEPDASIRTLLVAADCCLHELSAQGVATRPGLFDQYRGSIQRSGRMAPESPAFRFHGAKFLRAEGEQAVVRAAQLAQHAADQGLRLATLLQAGDWFQIKDHRRSARRYYARAEALARAQGPDHELSTPVMLFYPQPPLALRNREQPRTQLSERVVEVEFTVRADGKIDGERVLNRDAGKSAVDETLSALRAARFRPRIEDGDAVDVHGVRHRQSFWEMD